MVTSNQAERQPQDFKRGQECAEEIETAPRGEQRFHLLLLLRRQKPGGENQVLPVGEGALVCAVGHKGENPRGEGEGEADARQRKERRAE